MSLCQTSWVVCAILLTSVSPSRSAEPTNQTPREEAAAALRKAVTYFREHIATHGGYLWWYSEDLKERWGENKATASQVWVQPPGTPSVGMAYLRAYERTGDSFYRDAGRDVAHALAWGQLASGGWDYHIDFDPVKSRTFFYRRDFEAGEREAGKRRNTTTFDDDVSQSALRMLMSYDRMVEFKDAEAHRAALYALDRFIALQYPNGAWPQRCTAPPDPKRHPVRRARYPETWSRTFPGQDYKGHYTLNDGAMPDVIQTMALAHEIYGDGRYLDAALKGGEFLLLAQMPDPQPAWAQQYDADMCPAWARKFEPPSIVSRESVDAIRILMSLYVHTGQERFREPLDRAIAWFERSRLPDGRLARFYELHTNRPLYCNLKYELVYTDDDMPTHYAFKQNIDVAGLRKQLDDLGRRREQFVATRRPTWTEESTGLGAPPPAVTPAQARAVIDALDDQGRWVEDGRIKCATFIRNVDVLSAFVAK